MTPISDLDINRHIRQVMVKHWIDLGRLSIRSVRGRVTIHGILDRIPGVKERLNSSILEDMIREIKRVNGIERVTIDLTNWTNNDGRWLPLDIGKKMIQSESQTSVHRDTSYDIR